MHGNLCIFFLILPKTGLFNEHVNFLTSKDRNFLNFTGISNCWWTVCLSHTVLDTSYRQSRSLMILFLGNQNGKLIVQRRLWSRLRWDQCTEVFGFVASAQPQRWWQFFEDTHFDPSWLSLCCVLAQIVGLSCFHSQSRLVHLELSLGRRLILLQCSLLFLAGL